METIYGKQEVALKGLRYGELRTDKNFKNIVARSNDIIPSSWIKFDNKYLALLYKQYEGRARKARVLKHASQTIDKAMSKQPLLLCEPKTQVVERKKGYNPLDMADFYFFVNKIRYVGLVSKFGTAKPIRFSRVGTPKIITMDMKEFQNFYWEI